MRVIFIALLFMPLFIMAQIDYDYNRIDRISTQYPIKKIMWLKSAQSKQSLSFDHLVFFVNEYNDNDIVGDNVILNIYHNNKIIHTKEFAITNRVPNLIYLLTPINLKPKDSVYLIFSLKPNPYSTQSSYLININDRNTFFRNIGVYMKMTSNDVDPRIINSIMESKYQNPVSKTEFSEIDDPNKPIKKKKTNNNAWIDVLAFLLGFL